MEFYRSLGHIANSYLDHYSMQRGHMRPLSREQLTGAQDLLRDLLAAAETERLIALENHDTFKSRHLETTPNDYALAIADYWKYVYDKDTLEIDDIEDICTDVRLFLERNEHIEELVDGTRLTSRLDDITLEAATHGFIQAYKSKIGDFDPLDGDATVKLARLFLRYADIHEGNL